MAALWEVKQHSAVHLAACINGASVEVCVYVCACKHVCVRHSVYVALTELHISLCVLMSLRVAVTCKHDSIM